MYFDLCQGISIKMTLIFYITFCVQIFQVAYSFSTRHLISGVTIVSKKWRPQLSHFPTLLPFHTFHTFTLLPFSYVCGFDYQIRSCAHFTLDSFRHPEMSLHAVSLRLLNRLFLRKCFNTALNNIDRARQHKHLICQINRCNR